MKIKSPKRGGGQFTKPTSAEKRNANVTTQTIPSAKGLKINKVLVPVDFSECSLKALNYAVAFARSLSATIDLLYIVPPYYALDPYGVTEYQRVERDMRAAGEQRLAQLVLEQLPQEVPVEMFVRNGKPALEIIDAAKETNADLIIMSTHGHTGIKHVLVGSTTENVVRHAPCPVLVVRETERDFLSN